MFAARAFWIARRSAGLVSGLGPPAFTAMAMSLPMRVNAFAILSQRANIVALRVSKMRPMANGLSPTGHARARRGSRTVNVDPRPGSLSAECRRPSARPPVARSTGRTRGRRSCAPRRRVRSGRTCVRDPRPTCRCPGRGRRSRPPLQPPGRSRRSRREIGRPAPYLTALDSSLVRICSRRRRSQIPSIAAATCTGWCRPPSDGRRSGPPPREPARPGRCARAPAPPCRR